jgi:hypothetical protein
MYLHDENHDKFPLPPPLNLFNYLISFVACFFRCCKKEQEHDKQTSLNDDIQLEKIKCYSISVLKKEDSIEDTNEKISKISEKLKINQVKHIEKFIYSFVFIY